jgi:hypothetical protein
MTMTKLFRSAAMLGGADASGVENLLIGNTTVPDDENG